MRRIFRRQVRHTYRLDRFTDRSGRWWWRALPEHGGNTVFTSHESFSDVTECDDAIDRIINADFVRGVPRSDHTPGGN